MCRSRWKCVRRETRRELLEGRGDQLEQEGDKKGKDG